jgi:hypothetical protein
MSIDASSPDYQIGEIRDRVEDFSRLLDQIESLNDKKKRLWKEIYENAIIDRQHAYAMFIELSGIVKGKSTEHAVHGKTLATYIERMSRANDQLIKLAELIARADAAAAEINPDDMFSMINGN